MMSRESSVLGAPLDDGAMIRNLIANRIRQEEAAQRLEKDRLIRDVEEWLDERGERGAVR